MDSLKNISANILVKLYKILFFLGTALLVILAVSYVASPAAAATGKCLLFDNGYTCLNTTTIWGTGGSLNFGTNQSYSNNYTTGISFAQAGSLIGLSMTRSGASTLTASFYQDNLSAIASNIGNLSAYYPGIYYNISALQNYSNPNYYTNITDLQTQAGGFYTNITGLQARPDTYANVTSLQSGLSDVNSTALGKASPGACAAGFVVQNTTSSGVQCISITAGSGTVTQVDTGSFLSGGPVTTTGTISLNASSLVSNIGNWSADKGSYTLQSFSNGLATNISDVNASIPVVPYYYTNITNLQTQAGGFYTNITSLQSRPNTYANVTSLQAFTAGLYTNSTLINATAVSKASPGTATCSAGYVVQNITTSTGGVSSQCVLLSSGSVTSVGTTSFLYGGPITSTGTLGLNISALVSNIGNWSADKSSYTLQSFSNGVATNVSYLNSSKAGTGTVSCPAGSLVQNITTSTGGVSSQCITDALGVSEVDTGSFLTGGPITSTGTVSLDAASLVANIGNWSADKSSYTLQTFSNGLATNISDVNSSIAALPNYYSNITGLQTQAGGFYTNITSLQSRPNTYANVTTLQTIQSYLVANNVSMNGSVTALLARPNTYSNVTTLQGIAANTYTNFTNLNSTKAGLGTATCSAGTVAQNVTLTTGGVTTQCVTATSSGGGSSGWTVNSTLVYNDTGKVSIGTNSSLGKLTIYGSESGTDPALYVQGKNTGAAMFVNASATAAYGIKIYSLTNYALYASSPYGGGVFNSTGAFDALKAEGSATVTGSLTSGSLTVNNNASIGNTVGNILFGNGGGVSWNTTDTCIVSPANSTNARQTLCVTKPTG